VKTQYHPRKEKNTSARLLSRFGIRAILCFLLLTLIVSEASATPVFVETFDGSELNPDLWYNVNATISDGRAHMAITADDPGPGGMQGWGFGGFNSRFRLVGDFDIRIDFILDPWPASDGLHWAFCVQADDANLAYASMQRYWDYGHQGDIANIPLSKLYEVPASYTIGKYRLTRVGDVFSGYAWNEAGGTWNQVGAGIITCDLPLEIGVGGWTHEATFGHQTADVMVDNLTVETGTIVFIPEPATTSLIYLGSMVLFWRCRRTCRCK